MDPAKLIFAVTLLAPLLGAQSAGSISGPDADAAAVTDTAGAFRFSALPDGRYLMSVERDGFSSSQSGVISAARVAPL
jgi:hypothetical protein